MDATFVGHFDGDFGTRSVTCLSALDFAGRDIIDV